MDKNLIDIKENYIFHLDNELIAILLKDRSSKQNIIWATDNYSSRGCGYYSYDQITVQSVTGYNGSIIKPRTEKSQKEQAERVRQKAEVITPKNICDEMVALVPDDGFTGAIENGHKVLDIAGKAGEFALAIYGRYVALGYGIEKSKIRFIQSPHPISHTSLPV